MPGWLEDSLVIQVFCSGCPPFPRNLVLRETSFPWSIFFLWMVLAYRLILSSGVFEDLTADPSSRAEVLKQHALPSPLSTALLCWFLVVCSGF